METCIIHITKKRASILLEKRIKVGVALLFDENNQFYKYYSIEETNSFTVELDKNSDKTHIMIFYEGTIINKELILSKNRNNIKSLLSNSLKSN